MNTVWWETGCDGGAGAPQFGRSLTIVLEDLKVGAMDEIVGKDPGVALVAPRADDAHVGRRVAS